MIISTQVSVWRMHDLNSDQAFFLVTHIRTNEIPSCCIANTVGRGKSSSAYLAAMWAIPQQILLPINTGVYLLKPNILLVIDFFRDMRVPPMITKNNASHWTVLRYSSRIGIANKATNTGFVLTIAIARDASSRLRPQNIEPMPTPRANPELRQINSVLGAESNGNPVIASTRNDQKSIPNIVHKYRTEILGRCLSSNLLSITLTTAKLTEDIKERNIHMGTLECLIGCFHIHIL